MKNLFLSLAVILFGASSCTKYISVSGPKGLGTTTTTTATAQQPVQTRQVVEEVQYVSQQPQVRRVAVQQPIVRRTVVQEQVPPMVERLPQRSRRGLAVSGSVSQSYGPYGQSQTFSGGVAIGNVSVSGSFSQANNQVYRDRYGRPIMQPFYNNGYGQQPYYRGQQSYYQQGYNPYNNGYQQPYYNNFNQSYYYGGVTYDQYGRPYQPGSYPAWSYTTPYNTGFRR